MNTSGLVLDIYDDFSGATLRELYPDFDNIPGTVKQAQVAVQELPDDVFALVLINNGDKLRKYACVDEGNTVLSLGYFLKNAHKLPLEAQKTAAENLTTACSWYGIEPPAALEKSALGLGGAASLGLSALSAAPVVRGTHQALKENFVANNALRGAGHNVVGAELRDAALGRKTAEINGTTSAPLSPPINPSASVTGSKAVVLKTATIGRLVPGRSPDVAPDVTQPPTKVQATSLPQPRHLHPTVDITNKEPPRLLSEKKASIFALPTQEKYPLDSYVQVKAASAYFDTYVRHMQPPARREFAENLVKRAHALDIQVSDLARKYGAEDFAPEDEIKQAFDARRIEVAHDEDILKLLGAVEKVARFRMWKEASAGEAEALTADVVVDLLTEFDKVAGLDRAYDSSVPDPYYSIYGFDKTAGADFSEVIGNETVTEADLKRLARIAAATVKTTFGHDFQESFLEDPVGIFKSLPLDQKKMLMRMANSTQPGAERTYY